MYIELFQKYEQENLKNWISQSKAKVVETMSKKVEAKNIENTNTKETWSVVLTHLWDRESSLATHVYTKCISKIGRITGTYSCEELIRTFTKENGAWNYLTKGKSTSDHWLCQLNIRRHKKFINSEEFQNPHKQLDYCLEVWMDAKSKWKMPRYWHKMYDKMYNANQMSNRNKAISFVVFK